MARQRITPGTFLEINLEGEYYVYARILKEANYAFYDSRSSKKVTDLDLIASKSILFIVAVYNYAVNSGRWIKIGKKPLENRLEVLPSKFIQDTLDPKQYRLYDPNSGEMIGTDRESCTGLECAAVWGPEHVESRIKDHYDNKPNIWVEQLRLK